MLKLKSLTRLISGLLLFTCAASLSAQEEIPALPPQSEWRIVYDFQFPGDSDSQILTSNGDGSNIQQLTTEGRNMNPHWSADGSQIIFERAIETKVGTDLYVMDADGSNVIQLTNDEILYVDATWSPDGSKILFTLFDGEQSDIYIMNADWSNVINLTNHPASDSTPTWSHNSDVIAFASKRDSDSNTFSIYTLQLSTGEITRITDGASSIRPRFSPDDTAISYLVSDPYWQLYIRDLTTGTDTIFTGEFQSAEWMPDGTGILYTYVTKLYLFDFATQQHTIFSENIPRPGGGTIGDFHIFVPPVITPTPTEAISSTPKSL